MIKLKIAAGLTAGLALCGVADAALIDRGGGLIYDSDLNITWLANANYGAGSIYDDGVSTTDGQMSWNNAVAWAAGLSYYDSVRDITYEDWRLPTLIDTGTLGCDYAFSGTDCGYNVDTATGEMAHLHHDELGNLAIYDTSGDWQIGWVDGQINTGPFSNLIANYYWYGTEYKPNTDVAWYFTFHSARQGGFDKDEWFYAMAVREGDVSAIPLPAAALLFGSGLLGLIGISRMKAA